MTFNRKEAFLKPKKHYPPWAKGFIYKGVKCYHHYLEINFKFDSNV